MVGIRKKRCWGTPAKSAQSVHDNILSHLSFCAYHLIWHWMHFWLQFAQERIVPVTAFGQRVGKMQGRESDLWLWAGGGSLGRAGAKDRLMLSWESVYRHNMLCFDGFSFSRRAIKLLLRGCLALRQLVSEWNLMYNAYSCLEFLWEVNNECWHLPNTREYACCWPCNN